MMDFGDDKDPRDGLIRLLLKRLQQQEELLSEYQLILNHSPGHLFWVNQDHVLLGVNQEQAEILNATPAELIGKHLTEILPPEDAQYLMQINQQVMDSQKISIHEEYTCLESGEEKWFLTKKIPMLSASGQSIGVVGLSLDITEQKKAYKLQHQWALEQKYFRKVKSDFVANMSHDIRTPIAGLMGMASILTQRLTHDEDRQYARWIEESGKQLIDFLNMLLNFNVDSLDEEPGSLQLSPISIRSLMDNLLALEYPAIEQKRINFQLNLAFDVPVLVLTDYEKLYRVLLNILGNAIKFTSNAGSIVIHIEALQQDATQVQLAFKISDTGPGFSPEELQKIQHKTSDNEIKKISGGQGLGLQIVKQYLQRMNSELHVQSLPQGGSMLSFELQCALPQNQDLMESPLEQPSCALPSSIPSDDPKQDLCDEFPAKPSRVLIVEDNRIIAHLLQYGVQHLHLQPTLATGLHEAVGELLRNTFDFIITDLGLPDGSGMDLIRIIRSHELMQHVPILVLSAHISEKIRKECLAMGATDILEKPISLEKFKEVVARYHIACHKEGR